MTIPESGFIYISIFIVAIYIAMIIIGYHKGFLYEIINLVYTGLALLVSWFVSPVFAKMFPLVDLDKVSTETKLLNTLLNLNELINTITYFVIIFLLLKVCYIFISLLVKSLNKIPVVGKFNKILGGIFGIVNATIITLFISVLLSLPLFKNGAQIKEKTILKYVNNLSENVLTYLVEKAGESHIDKDNEEFDVEEYREEFKKWLETLK